MDKIVAKSLAKINFGLNIISKRDDGFHNLETVFYPLKLSDKLTFQKSDTFKFESNSQKLNSEKSNLVIKAKELLEEETNKKLNCEILLKKNIPIGAGLGGGSSNAATTLISLNKLFELKLNKKELLVLTLKLGSDVPFFINPVPSFATSRGQLLENIKLKLKGFLLIVNPGIHISTKWAFDNLTQYSEKGLLKGLINRIISGEDCYSLINNDFEKIIFYKYHQIKSIKDNLVEMGAYFSLMTGTGSTVYGIFHNRNDAETAKENFSNKYFTYIEQF